MKNLKLKLRIYWHNNLTLNVDVNVHERVSLNFFVFAIYEQTKLRRDKQRIKIVANFAVNYVIVYTVLLLIYYLFVHYVK